MYGGTLAVFIGYILCWALTIVPFYYVIVEYITTGTVVFANHDWLNIASQALGSWIVQSIGATLVSIAGLFLYSYWEFPSDGDLEYALSDEV